MTMKLVFSFLCLAMLSFGGVSAAELKPYQKEALEKLEAHHGKAMWPMIRQQYETVITGASEEEAKRIVEMITNAQGSSSPRESSSSTESSNGPDDYELSEAVREDLEKQIDPTYKPFISLVSRLGPTRDQVADQIVTDVIIKAEKGARLQAVQELLKFHQFVTHQSLQEGLKEVQDVRRKLLKSKKFHKVDMPSGNPPDTSEAVKAIIKETAERISGWNLQYGRIAADIKKRMDAIPYGGGVDIKKALDALENERARHNKALSDQVSAAVREMNNRIAGEDRKIFEWILAPLQAAQPQSGPVANR